MAELRSHPNQKIPKKKLQRNQIPDSGRETCYVQNGQCRRIAPDNPCMECRKENSSQNKLICRFQKFRLLKEENRQVFVVGFPDPVKDATKRSINLWMSNDKKSPLGLEQRLAISIISNVGKHFCSLSKQEQVAFGVNVCNDEKIIWKRVVKGVRELCDVCETTLFNRHWTCGNCGFSSCFDCYNARNEENIKISTTNHKCDTQSWFLCHDEQIHKRDTLMKTQIIPSNVLETMTMLLHETCAMLNIPMHCNCELWEEMKKRISPSIKCVRYFETLDKSKKNESAVEPMECDADDTAVNVKDAMNAIENFLKSPSTSEIPEEEFHLKAAPRCLGEESFHPEAGMARHHEKEQESRTMTLSISKALYPGVRHKWLCNGRLLCLLNPRGRNNYVLFQDQWRRGQPVLVSNVTKHLNVGLWTPQSFEKEFGDQINYLINSISGKIVANQQMSVFWNGFENKECRLKDKSGNFMLLKLKDWPAKEDFANVLPTRFKDLMKGLPLKQYTQRKGKLNLASRLPKCFVKPDLGPKMYCAYGSSLYPNKGTTNLHLDMSDAVNVMVYIGAPKGSAAEQREIEKSVADTIEGGDCDLLTKSRAVEELPGALWHIYEASDANKIRDFLNKVAIEKGGRLEANNDPIHDQSSYLTSEMRSRLLKEYNVRGYSIIQYMGDAVFIPAGAPHQVLNLLNCIKVAEDFVSPENVAHCFQLTEEFRKLSDTHTNHEDKLQIKNIIYHAVKDSMSVLRAAIRKIDPDYYAFVKSQTNV